MLFLEKVVRGQTMQDRLFHQGIGEKHRGFVAINLAELLYKLATHRTNGLKNRFQQCFASQF